MIGKEFNSIIEIFKTFPTEQACIEHLEQVRWNGNVVSPFDKDSKVYKCTKNRYWCKNSRRYFNAKANTIFENTKIPLVSWFVAIYLNTTHKKGISSLQLAKDIGVTQKTAWFMLQRIRACYPQPEEEPQLEGKVELDETFVGGKNKNRHWDKKVPQSQGRSFKDKTPVFGMLQRGGKVIAKVVPDTKAKTLRPYIDKHIMEESTVYTDEWNYGNLHEKYTHKQVFHAAKIYAMGDVYTNSIEGFWSILKRGYIGIYHYISRKHLQLYVNEFTFRYNTRDNSISQRFNLLLSKTGNRRLRYRELIN